MNGIFISMWMLCFLIHKLVNTTAFFSYEWVFLWMAMFCASLFSIACWKWKYRDYVRTVVLWFLFEMAIVLCFWISESVNFLEFLGLFIGKWVCEWIFVVEFFWVDFWAIVNVRFFWILRFLVGNELTKCKYRDYNVLVDLIVDF